MLGPSSETTSSQPAPHPVERLFAWAIVFAWVKAILGLALAASSLHFIRNEDEIANPMLLYPGCAIAWSAFAMVIALGARKRYPAQAVIGLFALSLLASPVIAFLVEARMEARLKAAQAKR